MQREPDIEYAARGRDLTRIDAPLGKRDLGKRDRYFFAEKYLSPFRPRYCARPSSAALYLKNRVDTADTALSGLLKRYNETDTALSNLLKRVNGLDTQFSEHLKKG